MNKILQKWYLGLIIIPVIVNLLTDLVKFPDFLKSWDYTIIGILLIISIILAYELVHAYRIINQLKKEPKSGDKKIINELLKTLDIDLFQSAIKEQYAKAGYDKQAFKNTINFKEKSEKLSFKTTNKKLNLYITELKDELEKFGRYGMKHLTPDEFFYTLDKSSKQEIADVIEEMSEEAFKKMTVLITFCKKHNYIE